MEFRIIPRPTPVHSREFRTVRIDGQSVQPRSPATAHAPPDHKSTRKTRRVEANLRRLTGPPHEPEKRNDG